MNVLEKICRGLETLEKSGLKCWQVCVRPEVMTEISRICKEEMHIPPVAAIGKFRGASLKIDHQIKPPIVFEVVLDE